MIDQELKQRALTPAAKGEAAPREKILKLGKKLSLIHISEPTRP